jgi:carbon monoxide dehydrogenase subunit G
MVRVSATELVPAPPGRVFDFVDTPANHERISPSIASVHDVEPLDGGGHRASYTYRMVGVSLSGDIEVVTHERPRRLTFAVRGGIDGEMDWRFAPADGDGDREAAGGAADDWTRVTCEATFGVPGGALASLLDPLVRAVNQRELDRTLANLREATAAPGARSAP